MQIIDIHYPTTKNITLIFKKFQNMQFKQKFSFENLTQKQHLLKRENKIILEGGGLCYFETNIHLAAYFYKFMYLNDSNTVK